MTIASGYFGIVSQAAEVIMIYLLSLSYMSVLGLQSTTGTLIGNQIGNANVIQAKEYFKIACYFLALSDNPILNRLLYRLFLALRMGRPQLPLALCEDFHLKTSDDFPPAWHYSYSL